jgi:hypothetical protein
LQSPSEQGAASVDGLERYEVIDGVRVAREPMGAFETVLASWLCHLIRILQRTDTFEPMPIHAVVWHLSYRGVRPAGGVKLKDVPPGSCHFF